MGFLYNHVFSFFRDKTKFARYTIGTDYATHPLHHVSLRIKKYNVTFMKILIVAGGTGSRLWPASRKSQPKQLLKLINDKTLLQNTYERFLGAIRPTDIFVATTSEYAKSVSKQLPAIPQKNYSIEPVLRDRGPAIGLAALIIDHAEPNAVFATAWSDSYIQPARNLIQLLKKTEKFLKNNPEAVINVGIKPTFPHPGLGYIETGKTVHNSAGLDLFELKSFKEKPGKDAEKMIRNGRHLWNPGIFVWRTKHLLSLYEKHLPEVYEILMKIKPSLGTQSQQKTINAWFPKMPKVEIETGILEKITENFFAVTGNFEWADVGSWKVIKDVLAPGQQNLTTGQVINHDTVNSLIYNYSPHQLVTTLGVDNLAIIVTDESILVAHKDRSEDLKQLIKRLQADKKLSKHL